MELRHYKDGYLRYAWFGENYDWDGSQIFSLKNRSYAGNNASSKFRGNVQIYLNKYDSATKAWVPLSECPFAFWDYNRDGHGDTVLRVSAAPLASLTGSDTDYANNYDYMWSPRTTPLESTGNVNVRFSFNIDPQPRRDPLSMPHYSFGFTMVGAAPYKYSKMFYTNSRRRPPQKVVRVDWTEGVAVGMNYPARETGFTWDESRSVWRWEGQFWIYERILLSNTGGPTHRWNMRREYSATPSNRRRIYYSDADKRYHLLGASEGWMEAGHLVNQQKDLEFRWRDLDGDGYLDECQVFDAAHTGPVRVSRFAPRAHEVALDRDTLIREYNERILPRAIEEDKALIAALKQIASNPLADAYIAEAQKAEMPERQRYCLDIARELYFLQVRNLLYDRLASSRYMTAERSRAHRGLEPNPTDGGYNLGDSLLYWKLAKRIELLTDHYGAGEFSEFLSDLQGIKRGAEMAPWTP
ncbi:MAG: fimbrillin family protein, partial [Bryobacteraceae bacterium]